MDLDDASTIVVSTPAKSPARVVDKGKGVERAPMAESTSDPMHESIEEPMPETEEVTRLAPALPPTSAPVVPTGSSISYETAPSMEALRLRQFQEDAEAYKIDLNFAQDVLTNPNLTPPEERTWQLRILDVSHRIRYCTHQVDIIRFEQRARTAASTRYASSSGMQSKAKSVKRPAPADDKGEGSPAKRVKARHQANHRHLRLHSDTHPRLFQGPRQRRPPPVQRHRRPARRFPAPAPRLLGVPPLQVLQVHQRQDP